METGTPSLLEYDPFHPPHWRWERAEHLAGTGRPPDPRLDDEWVVAARRAMQQPRGGDRRTRDIRTAHAAWEKDGARRWELEALLLTAEPYGRVAKRCGLTAEVVAAYERVFFCVRGAAANATDWLQHEAVGYSPGVGLTAELPAGVWKLAAFSGGALALAVVMVVTTGGPLPEGFVTAAGRQGEVDEARVRLKTRLWIQLLTARTDAEFAAVIRAKRGLDEAFQTESIDPPLAVHEDFLLALPRMRTAATNTPTREGRDEQADRQARHDDRRPSGATGRQSDNARPKGDVTPGTRQRRRPSRDG
jgi:hypothetical protein